MRQVFHRIHRSRQCKSTIDDAYPLELVEFSLYFSFSVLFENLRFVIIPGM